MKWMINDREEALVAHELARTRIANQKQSNFTPFKKNQKVWLDMRNLNMNHHKKIAPKWEGPFEIDKVLRPVTYRLKLPNSWKIHNVFHAALLRLYIENKVYGKNYPRPLPKLLKEKKFMKLKLSLNTDKEEGDTNTMWNRKDTLSPKLLQLWYKRVSTVK
jgi:hypothetical protein